MTQSLDDFDSIEGHSRPKETLKRAIARSRLHHAYLFTGQSGIGKRLMAMVLAKALNCEAADPGRACGQCRSCGRINEGQHPDVLIIEPDRSKARWVIKIEQIRELGPQVAFRPYMGRRRVVIIDEAETMMVEAANALLKTLEEPSGETVFVLVSAAPSALLPTIISRCQLLRFGPLDRETIERFLLSKAVAADRARVIAGYADGSMSRALDLAAEGALEAQRELVAKITSARDIGPMEVFKIASDISKVGNTNLRVLLDGLLFFYRDVAMLSAGAPRDLIINSDMLAEIEAVACRLTTEEVLSHIDQVAAAQVDLQSYVDTKLLLERLLFDVAASPPG